MVCSDSKAEAGAGLAGFVLVCLLGALAIAVTLSFLKLRIGSGKRLILNSIMVGLGGISILFGITAAGVLGANDCYDNLTSYQSSLVIGLGYAPLGVVLGVVVVVIASLKLVNDVKGRGGPKASGGVTHEGPHDPHAPGSYQAPPQYTVNQMQSPTPAPASPPPPPPPHYSAV